MAFWSLDALKGGYVRKALDLIRKCEDGIWSDSEVMNYQKTCLEKLLQHCKDTVPYYRDMQSLDLKEWPVMNKSLIKENQEKCFSSVYDKESLITMSTSGSTGTPFVCYQDAGKKRHVNAEVLYYNGKAGYKIGKKIVYFRSIVGEVEKSRLQQFLQNIVLVDCNNLSDDAITHHLEVIRKESKGCGAMILGYSSTLDAFRRYFDKYGYDKAEGCNITGIVGGSEMFQDVTRDGMIRAFGCICFSRYANEENGFLGQDSTDRNVFLPNRANYYFEILKLDSDEPAEDGEVGRIVITDLYNYAMPMVRYDTGDVGAWVKTSYNGHQRKAIGCFGGRVVDMIFDCKGIMISPFAITNNMWQFKELRQFQFIQKAPTQYLVKLNPLCGKEVPINRLREVLVKIVGVEAVVDFQIVDEIPVLASGKRRYIVNESRI